MAARRERGLLDPDAAPGESPFDHHIYALCSDGDIQEGVSGEASSLAGTQRLGNLTLIYDSNRISIEDDTNIALSEDTARPLRRVRLARADGRLDPRRHLLRRGRRRPGRRDRRRREGHRPAQLHRAADDHRLAGPEDAGHRQGRTAPRWATRRSPPPRRSSASTRSRPSRSPTRSSPTPAGWSSAAEAAHAEWQTAYDAWAAANPEGKALHDRLVDRELPAGWRDALPTFDADPKGVATRAASGKVLAALAAPLPELWGGSADLAESNNTTMEGEPSFLPDRPAVEEVPRQPVRPHPALRHPRARHGLDHERHRGARRHPPVRRHVPGLLRLHARRGPAVGADAGPGDLRVDPRLHRGRRGRPDPPADRARRRAAGHPRTGRGPTGRRQRDRRGLGHHPGAQRPARRSDPDPAERARPSPAAPTASPTSPAWPRAATCSRTHVDGDTRT